MSHTWLRFCCASNLALALVLVLVWLGCPLNQALGAQTFGIESDAVMEMETSETVFIEYRIFTADSTGSDHLLYRYDGTTTLEEEHKHYQRVEQGEITAYTGTARHPPPPPPPPRSSPLPTSLSPGIVSLCAKD